MALRDKNFNEIVTFTRASEGTFVDSDGLIKTALADQPRFDHDPVTGEPLGLLVEESRTNVIPFSNKFEDGFIQKVSSTVLKQETLFSPTGENAYLLSLNEGADAAKFLRYAVITSGVFSIFVKRSESRYIFFGDDNPAVRPAALFDFETEEVSRINDGVSGVNILIAEAIKYNDGWYRLVFDNDDVVRFAVSPRTPDTEGNIGAFNNATNLTGDCFISGLQAEAGTFPTSYIPTNGSEVTRVADSAKIGGDIFEAFSNNETFSLFVDVVKDFQVNRNILSINDTAFTDFITFAYIVATNKIRVETYHNTTRVNAEFDIDPLDNIKVGFSYDANNKNITAVCNSDIKLIPINTFVANKLNKIQLGAIEQFVAKGATYKDLKYFPRALSDLELIQLTSPFNVQTTEVDTTQDPSFEADFVNDSSTVAEA